MVISLLLTLCIAIADLNLKKKDGNSVRTNQINNTLCVVAQVFDTTASKTGWLCYSRADPRATHPLARLS